MIFASVHECSYHAEFNPGESTRLKVNKVDYDEGLDDIDTYSLQSSDDEEEVVDKVSYEDFGHTMQELECWNVIIHTTFYGNIVKSQLCLVYTLNHY